MEQLRREPSPWRPLLVWLGPWFALVDLSLVVIFLSMVAIAFSGMLTPTPPGGPPTPPSKSWLPTLTILWIAAAALVPAQGILGTLCLTWSPGSFWRRLVTHWLVVLIALICFVAGLPVFHFLSALLDETGTEVVRDFWINGWRATGTTWDEVQRTLALFAALPMILFGAQAPFWCLRLFGGVRLVHATSLEEQSLEPERSKEALSISDLLWATALVAVSLALLQFSDRVMAGEGVQARAFLINTLVISGVSVVFSLLTGVPLVLIFFSRMRLHTAWGLMLTLTGIYSMVMFSISEKLTPSPNSAEQFGATCLFAYTYACGVATGLTALRWSGWRLAPRNMRYSAKS